MSTIIFDGTNHPPAATLIADGLAGGLLYCGTPASAKDFTAAQYADYKAHKLITIFGYEHLTTDISGGYAAGLAHASDFLADARAKHVDLGEPALSAVDEHVTAANIPLAMQYQDGFRAGLRAGGWQGPIGIYGFSEVLIAAHQRGNADFYFGAGSRSSMPPYTNLWQDNTQTIQVGGSPDDRDVVLIPLPSSSSLEEDTVPLTPADIAAVAHAVAAYKNPDDPKDVDLHQHAVDGTAALNAVLAVGVQVTAIQGSLSTRDAALLAAIQAAGQHVDVELAPDELAAVTAPITTVLASLPTAVKQAIGQALVAPETASQ